MNILHKIIENKKNEVSRQKRIVSASQLTEYPLYYRNCHSLKKNLVKNESGGIIAEFKQKSPSQGEINFRVSVEQVTKGYTESGAAGLSILTDFVYFGGTLANLLKARENNPDIPILRKDFIIDIYQITESKAMGADVILLIAACLGRYQISELAEYAKTIGMEVILEIHKPEDLERINQYVDLVGVNNRNLDTFKVDIETSVRLSSSIPGDKVKISESGLSKPETVHYLRNLGYSGFLIGELFMKTPDPVQAFRKFIDSL